VFVLCPFLTRVNPRACWYNQWNDEETVMNGFKIMLGAIGVQLIVFGVITLAQGFNIITSTPMSGAQQAIYVGAVLALIGAALAAWPARSGLLRDLAGAVSVLFALFGCVWMLQGVNILPGSFMSGAIVWTYIGAVWVAIAIALFVFATRRPKA